MTPDAAISIIRARWEGRTRYVGQDIDPAEILADEVERLRRARLPHRGRPG